MSETQDPYFLIGWYNEETGEWDKEEPSLPAFMKGEEAVADEGDE